MKMLLLDKCKDCAHHDEDPQTVDPNHWGKSSCVWHWNGHQDREYLIKPVDPETIPEDCPLPDYK